MLSRFKHVQQNKKHIRLCLLFVKAGIQLNEMSLLSRWKRHYVPEEDIFKQHNNRTNIAQI